MNTLFLLIGGNEGNRKANMKATRTLIEQEIGRIVLKSSLYNTEPWGFEPGRDFINQALRVETELSPPAILNKIGKIESYFGRTRVKGKYTSREMDIDILFYNDAIINLSDLTVPHPRLQERKFVLIPMAELAPEFIHPVLKLTIARLLQNCPDKKDVRKIVEDE